MNNDKGVVSVLIVSASQKMTDTVMELLPYRQFAPVDAVKSAGEAGRLLVDKTYDLVIITAPLKDDFGVNLAINVARNGHSGVLLFVKSELYEQVTFKVEDDGVLTMAIPCQRQAISQTIRLMVATKARMRVLEEKNISLEVKMEEIRTINRAKLLLMERLHMTEAEAHRYIEKTAMDTCVKRVEIAKNVIQTYDS